MQNIFCGVGESANLHRQSFGLLLWNLSSHYDEFGESDSWSQDSNQIEVVDLCLQLDPYSKMILTGMDPTDWCHSNIE